MPDAITARLPLDGPFDADGLAAWLGARAIRGVDRVEGHLWSRAVRLPHGPGIITVDLSSDAHAASAEPDAPISEGATAAARDDAGSAPKAQPRAHAPRSLSLEARLSDRADLANADGIARRFLDLRRDRPDPRPIDEHLARAIPLLAPLIERRPGVRLPGQESLPEALLWAITGQQVSAQRARALIEAATDLTSAELPPELCLDRAERASSPGPVRTAVDPVEAAATADAWFRGPGARRRAIATAVPVAAELDPSAPVGDLREALIALPGIGPWTADYALLRGVGAPDVSAPKDVALLRAARHLGLADDHDSLTRALEPAEPFRSYALMQLWHHASTLPPVTRTRSRTASREHRGA